MLNYVRWATRKLKPYCIRKQTAWNRSTNMKQINHKVKLIFACLFQQDKLGITCPLTPYFKVSLKVFGAKWDFQNYAWKCRWGPRGGGRLLWPFWPFPFFRQNFSQNRNFSRFCPFFRRVSQTGKSAVFFTFYNNIWKWWDR